ncbi:ankyrin [Xylaria arbuscula]|nr:ankyrin [Xylaria arbuscula]
MSLAKLKETIDNELGMTIPLSRYRRKIEQLGLRKYTLKRDETDMLSIVLARMPRGSKLFRWGELLPQAYVERIRSRGRPPIFLQVGPHQLPRGYNVRPPTPDRVDHFSSHMPFLDFIQALPAIFEHHTPQCLLDDYIPPAGTVNDVQESWTLGGTFFGNNPRAVAVLDIVPPLSIILLNLNLLLRRQLLFSIANGFAGIDNFPIWQPFKLLQGITVQALIQLFRVIQACIESGNHIILDVILSCEATCIDVNKEMIFVSHRAYTPIIKTYNQYGPNGALECAANGYTGPDDETFKLLANAVPTISSGVLRTVLRHNERCFIHLIREHMQKCESDSKAFSSLMAEAITARRYKVESSLLNIVAERGYAKLYEKMVSEHGFYPDDDTLFASIRGGNLQLVESLLPCGPSIHRVGEREYRSKTLLSIAIKEGQKEMINLLRSRGAFRCFPCWDVFLEAWNAAENTQNKELLGELIKVKPDIPDCYEFREWALKVAYRTGNYEMAQEQLENNVTVWLENNSTIWLATNANVWFDDALELAIRNQHLAIVELLLCFNAYIKPKHITLAAELGLHSVVCALLAEGVIPGREALHAALRRKDEALADILLNAGADINGKKDGEELSSRSKHPCKESALQVTAGLGNRDLVQNMLKKGADPNDSLALSIAYQTDLKDRYNRRLRGFGSTILASAVKSQDLALVRMLLEHNVDAHGFDGFVEQGYKEVTPFGYAIFMDSSNDLGIVSTFLKHHCSPSAVVALHATGTHGTNAFLAAIERGNIELIRLLLREDEKVIHALARGRAERTALQRAAEMGSLEMVELLHNLSADINEPPNQDFGATALQLAAIGGIGQIVEYLIDHGADINAPAAAWNGMTALVGAASRGRIDIVAMLLNKGAGRGEDGREQFEKALDEAKRYGHYPTYDYLMERWNGQQREVFLREDFSMEEFVNLDDSDEGD